MAKSDLIVLAEFLSERDDRVEVVYKRQFVGGIRDDVARTYRILETIKGGQHPGGQIVVWWSRQYQELDPFRAMGAAPPPGYVQPGPRVYEQPPAERGKVYALFLTLLPYEEPIWSWTGDPWQAELAGNRLKFQAVSWYQGMCDGKLAPGSQAPFELTLPQLRELARPP